MAKIIMNVQHPGLSMDGDQKFSSYVETAFCSIFYYGAYTEQDKSIMGFK